MCTGKCAKFIGGALYPFAIICIVSNTLLYFPGWSSEAAEDAGLKLTSEVSTLLGIVGGGIMMLLSVLCAAIGLTGSLFCLVMSVVGITRGPVCAYYDQINATTPSTTGNKSLVWGRPFENPLEKYNNESYLYHRDVWSKCVRPPNVVEFNIILFSILMAASSFEVILCAVQFFNGLFGVICGTCNKDDNEYKDMKKEPSYSEKDADSVPEKKEIKC